MTDEILSARWGERFGLARSPYFASEQVGVGGEHHVLLDGGHGSFGLSVVEERVNPTLVAGWAWSSDLPHHVAVAKEEVQVVRWDQPREAQLYSLASVCHDLDGFYRFLRKDRVNSNRTVVKHLVNLFGRIRSIAAHKRLRDERSIDAFVTVLGDLIAGDDGPADAVTFGLPEDAADIREMIAGPTLEEALRDIRSAPEALSSLKLSPSLAIRHAGGRLFQEAHFDFIRAPSPDLFNFVEVAVSDKNSRGGTHFTPPALARSIVDHTLAQVPDLAERPKLVICDPACGSAAFLHEALRGLRRTGFDGALHIVGRDISSAAITMARFTMNLALRDWMPTGGVTLDVEVGDSLDDLTFPKSDVTVMNPPFISVIAQTPEQKAQLRAIVGSKVGSRGDYSMAFVTRALEKLNDRGALGTLFPANLLTHDAVAPWREHLAVGGDVRLLARIGDFGLFSEALVHVACVVIAKNDNRRRQLTALVTENKPEATSDALRALRKTRGGPPTFATTDDRWQMFAVDAAMLEKTLPWHLLTPEQRRILDALEALETPTVKTFFDIAQGVQTGNLNAFLFSEDDFRMLDLPIRERRYFRPALMTDSIENGSIVKIYQLFYPHDRDGALFASEEALAKAVPTYYARVLKALEPSLKKRAAIVRANRPDWWGLMHPRTRTFAFDSRPRIVSKFFGAEGSFALDEAARYLPSTGHVWMQKPPSVASPLQEIEEEYDEDLSDAASADVMHAYVTLLNSRPFIRLVSFRSVTIAGGQFDLSSRFLSAVHIPDLWEKAKDPRSAQDVRALASISRAALQGKSAFTGEVHWRVARLYGVPELAQD